MRTGHRYGQQFGLTALSLFKDQDEIDNSPEQKFGTVRPGDVKYMDMNNDGVIDADDEHGLDIWRRQSSGTPLGYGLLGSLCDLCR